MVAQQLKLTREEAGLRFTFQEVNGGVYGRAERVGTGKQIGYYRFRSVEARERWAAQLVEQEQARAAERARRSEAGKAAREAFVNPHRVGDLFHTSWGYDQTNVEWFECVAVTAKSVTLREVAGERQYTASMSGTTRPKAGQFVGEPFRVVIQIRVDRDGRGYHYLPARHGSYYPDDGKAVGFSEYA
jgi:hypothetical protein